MKFWAQSKGHEAALFTDTIEDNSEVIKTILNKNHEFQIGDTIIWFKGGNFYRFNIKEESNLHNLKNNLSSLNLIGSWSATPINSNLRASKIPMNGGDAHNQKQFFIQYYQPCGGARVRTGGEQKYVHELISETIQFGHFYPQSFLKLGVKLEYWGKGSWNRGKWKPAKEKRTISINIKGYAYLSSRTLSYPTENIKLSISDACSDNMYFTLATDNPRNIFYRWVVSINGTIFQHVNGDIPENAWSNTGELW